MIRIGVFRVCIIELMVNELWEWEVRVKWIVVKWQAILIMIILYYLGVHLRILVFIIMMMHVIFIVFDDVIVVVFDDVIVVVFDDVIVVVFDDFIVFMIVFISKGCLICVIIVVNLMLFMMDYYSFYLNFSLFFII
jgi:hypothetical protein